MKLTITREFHLWSTPLPEWHITSKNTKHTLKLDEASELVLVGYDDQDEERDEPAATNEVLTQHLQLVTLQALLHAFEALDLESEFGESRVPELLHHMEADIKWDEVERILRKLVCADLLAQL